MSKSTTYTVYCITCVSASMDYVGVSKQHKKRLNRHLCDLRNGTHVNKPLQLAFVEHGEASFRVRILESLISQSQIRAREKHWIGILDTFRNGFNLNRGGGGIEQVPPELPLAFYDLDFPQKPSRQQIANYRATDKRLDYWSPPKPELDPGLKYCGRCRKWIELTRFSPDKRTYDGLQYYCKFCRAEYAREHYHAKKK